MKERGGEGKKESDWDVHVVSSYVAAFKDACCRTRDGEVAVTGREEHVRTGAPTRKFVSVLSFRSERGSDHYP